jgi:hypothetical protein
MKIREIIRDYLLQNKCDGFYLEDADGCSCSLEEGLFPCGEPSLECKAGVKSSCDCGEHDFHIVSKDFLGRFNDG